MKNILMIMLLLFIPVYIFAQTKTTKQSPALQTPKYVKLNEKDPLIGEWEWEKDPTGSPYSPLPAVDFIYMRFSPVDSLSVGALENNESKGLLNHCYFTAYSNGSTITATLSSCSNPLNNGKQLVMHYEVTGDELVITLNGEKTYYRRKN
ncbi:MAG: hypothetical protein ABIQ40_14735 [Bacteroidia bacterium]